MPRYSASLVAVGPAMRAVVVPGLVAALCPGAAGAQSADAKAITVGKGVAYSSTTALVSFLVFSRGAIRGSYEMFVACVAAIIIITVTTFLAVPLFYKWDEDGQAKA